MIFSAEVDCCYENSVIYSCNYIICSAEFTNLNSLLKLEYYLKSNDILRMN